MGSGGFARRDAAVDAGAVGHGGGGEGRAVGDAVVGAVVALDRLAPGEDAVGRGGVEGVAFGSSGGSRGSGGAPVKDFLGERGGAVPIFCAETFPIRAVLPEDFDAAHVVSGDDDVAVEVGRASYVGRRFFGFGWFGWGDVYRGWSRRNAIYGIVAILSRRFRRVMGFRSADECDGWWIAEFVKRITRRL